MDDSLVRDAAGRFSRAADALVDACRKLEKCGLPDEPIERLLQSLEAVTHEVHRLRPPEARVQVETADVATPACHIAAGTLPAGAEPGEAGSYATGR